MDVEVRIGHFDAVCVELSLDIPVDGEQGGPVVIGGGPDLQHIFDGAVTVVLHGGEGSLLLQNGGNFRRGLPQGVQHTVDGSGIGSGNGNVDTAGAGGGVVDDLGGGNGTVGDGNQLVVSGGQLGIGQADLLDDAGLAGNLNKVARVEGVGGQKDEAAEYIGQGVLQSQGNGQSSHGGQSDDAGDIQAQLGGNNQRQQSQQQDLGGGEDQLVNGLFQLGLFQSLFCQFNGETDGNDANDQDQQRGQQLRQGKIGEEGSNIGHNRGLLS